ncbi:lysylphosphatidylglycerol synthase transmembrane domain-containing protein [Gordonia sp. (in: high G+C Gram-positive bacteria)]|uniref:lysylphosphatidylglycerol synthase transmembrane domain-containing protein n=1 Tax=Gordonia sp. (in: high G+C Gram-positive bacteria) TaxID=84139 RepID=UPI0039E31228
MAKSLGAIWQRSRKWLRWVVLVVIIAVLAVEGYLIRDQFAAAWARVGDVHWGWLCACFVASMLNLDSFARVQRALFRSAGVIVSQWRSLSVILAANSLSQTMPGGQVLAPAFTYRETRRWGANPVVASWQVVMAGLIAGVGLATLGIVGALMAGVRTNPYSVMFSIIGFIAFVAVLQYLSTHPATVHAWGSKILRWYNELRNKPEESGQERLRLLIDQLGAVQLTRRDATVAFGWSLFNWITDIFCLMFACWAIGAHPSIAGIAVAYATSKAAGIAIPLLPGGLGVADVAMVLALVPAGMDNGTAAVAVILYRLVSFVLVSLIGWVVILAMYRSRIKNVEDSDDEFEESLRTTTGPSDPDRPLVDFTDDQRRMILGHHIPDAATEDDEDDGPTGDDAWKLP